MADTWNSCGKAISEWMNEFIEITLQIFTNTDPDNVVFAWMN